MTGNKNKIAINKFIFLYGILLVLMREIIANDDSCGKPGLYKHTIFTVKREKNQTDVNTNFAGNLFSNGTVIKYSCINPNDHIDDSSNATRVCVNGKWIGRISRCAQNKISVVKRFEVHGTTVNKSIFTSSGSSIPSLPYSYIAHHWPQDCHSISINNTLTNKIVIHLNYSLPFNYIKTTLLYKNALNTNVRAIARISETKTCKTVSTEKFEIYESLSFLCHISNSIIEDNSIALEQKLNYLNESYNRIELMFNTNELSNKTKTRSLNLSICDIRLYSIPNNDCGQPDHPLHSVVLSNNHFAQFTCEQGYDISPLRLNGYHVMCDINSEWKDQFPVCLEKMYCDIPNTYNSTEIVLRNNIFSVVNGVNVTSRGTIAVYTCANILFNGLPTMLNTTWNTRECRNGKWTGVEPRCVSIKYNITMDLSVKLKTILIALGSILLLCIIIILSFIVVCCCRRNGKKQLPQTIIRETEMNPYESVRMSDITIGSYYEHFYEDITNSITASNNIYNFRNSGQQSQIIAYNSNPLRNNSIYTSNSSYC